MPENALRRPVHLRQHFTGHMPAVLTRRLQVVRGVVPVGAVYVGRASQRYPHLPASRWGNPYRMRTEADRDRVVDAYAALFDTTDPVLGDLAALLREEAQAELRGQHLACWCPTTVRCHADVLLRVAAGLDPTTAATVAATTTRG